MDISFPLRYEKGSLKFVKKDSEITFSQGRHLINTIERERILEPSFGIPLDLLFSIPIRDIITERFRLKIELIQNIKAQILIKDVENGQLEIDVTFIINEENYQTFLRVNGD